MKLKIILTVFASFLLLFSCKKESNTAAKLKVSVTGLTSGKYSISISDKNTGISIFAIDYKTENQTYEAEVKPGSELSIVTSRSSSCRIIIDYKGQQLFNNQGSGMISTTIKIPQ